MKYTDKQLAYILYNNRSVEGVVSNFLKHRRFDAARLSAMEDMLEWVSSKYKDEQTVAVQKKDFQDADDFVYSQDDLTLTCIPAVKEAHIELLDPVFDSTIAEKSWLESRGITKSIIRSMKLGSLSYVAEFFPQTLQCLGVSIHPTLDSILDSDIGGGGIVIPLFDGERLVNCTTRRISDVGKLKYVQSCPDLDVWFFGEPSEEIWIAEGLFDAGALHDAGKSSASVSSAMWSGPQLYQLVERAHTVNIFADSDRVGLRSAVILQRFLRMVGLTCDTWLSSTAKDPAEHFLEKKLGWDEVHKVNITREMIGTAPDMTFNFIEHLKQRKF